MQALHEQDFVWQVPEYQLTKKNIRITEYNFSTLCRHFI